MERHPVGMRVFLICFLCVAHPAAEVAASDGAHICVKDCLEIGAAGLSKDLINNSPVLHINVADMNDWGVHTAVPDAADSHREHTKNASRSLKVLGKSELVVKEIDQCGMERICRDHTVMEPDRGRLFRKHR